MKNIVLSDYQSDCLNDLQTLNGFCYCDQKVFVYVQGHVFSYRKDGESLSELCDLNGIVYRPTGSHPELVDITYAQDKNILYMILQSGEIVSLELKDNDCDVVGSIENGVQAAKWSPEQDLIAVVTGNNTVLVLTNDFEPLSEVDLHGGEFGEKQFINVGWGKKETQFRGSEGKLKLNGASEEENKILDDNNTVQTLVSWRGDADYFAVSSQNPETCQRYLRIFSREGILQYTSEDIPNLEPCLAWRPSGNLIACTQKLPNKHVVCLIEKNGLKHAEFTLNFDPNTISVKKLIWNNDSKLLAINLEKISQGKDSSKLEYLQVYAVQNYHWYCKYSVEYLINEQLLFMEWDQKGNNTLHVIVKKQNKIYHETLSWLWAVNKSFCNCARNESLVGVIDGNNILMTAFNKGIIPPPMCSYKIFLPTFAQAIGFNCNMCKDSSIENCNCNDIFVQLANGSVLIYKFVSEKQTFKFEHVDTLNTTQKNNAESLMCYNILWLSPKTFVQCKIKMLSGDLSAKSYLSVIQISDMSNSIGFNESELAIKSPVRILKPIEKDVILVHDNTGSTYSFKANSFKITEPLISEKLSLIEIDTAKKSDGTSLIFSLDKSNKFFINDCCIANNITSFLVHEKYLLLTSLKQQLLCVNMQTDILKVVEGNNLPDVFQRKIERGSRLVISILQETKVVLQMPRGNLECIQPRALSLDVIGKFIDNCEYFKAFNLMRKQRINLNLLYDHDPCAFISNVDIFVDQIKDPSWLSLFLSELTCEDVTRSMYSVIYNREKSHETSDKIDTICTLIENSITRRTDSEKFLLPVLTTYIKRNRVEFIETALLKIKETMEREKNAKLPVSSTDAFKYVLCLIDVEELYKVALGMYDFEMVMFVASWSHKDPKEYLPFLNELKKLESNYQKYTIDKYLKRHEKALQNLMLCDGDEYFSELMGFIKAHKLHSSALKFMPRTTDRYKQVCTSYAEDLMTSRCYEDAGIMFSKAGSNRNAVRAFSKAGNWKEVISCSRQLMLPATERDKLLSELAGELVEAKRFKEASIVHLDYLKNLEESLVVLCQGKEFDEAFRLVELHDCHPAVATHIKPGILEHSKILKVQIFTFHEQFLSQKNRLLVVREKKQRDALEFEQGGSYVDNPDSDLYSEVSSVVTQSNITRSTARTFRSSKNRRKQEKKLMSLKEGSPFEDLALVMSLHKVVTNSYEIRKETKDINIMLVKINEESRAVELQKALEILLKDIEYFKSEIWIPELISSQQEYGPDATSNSISAMHTRQEKSGSSLLPLQYLIPPSANDILWKLEILKS